MEDDMKDLIARLEAEEVGSREFDVAIWAEFQSLKVKVIDFWSVYGDEQKTAVGFSLPPKRTRVTTNKFGGFSHADPVTTSLDDALALLGRVLPAWDWQITKGADEMALACISHSRKASGPEVCAHTPALALCVAILRAKQIDTASNPR